MCFRCSRRRSHRPSPSAQAEQAGPTQKVCFGFCLFFLAFFVCLLPLFVLFIVSFIALVCYPCFFFDFFVTLIGLLFCYPCCFTLAGSLFICMFYKVTLHSMVFDAFKLCSSSNGRYVKD